MAANHFLRPLLSRAGDSPHGLCVAGRAAAVATTLEAAFDSARRNRGLLGRDVLAAGTALILAPCSAIHTFGMQFPIDVIFASREGRVVKVTHRLAPRRISVRLGAFAVIELAAGEASRHGLKIGDVLVVRPLPGQAAPTSPPPPRP